MEYINLHYRGDLYRIIYDADALVVVDVLWYCTPERAISLDYDDLEPDLKELVDKAVRS